MPLAASLAARLAAKVRLVTVTSPGVDRLGDELYQRSIAAGLDVPVEFVVAHASGRVAEAILDAADVDDVMIAWRGRAHRRSTASEQRQRARRPRRGRPRAAG